MGRRDKLRENQIKYESKTRRELDDDFSEVIARLKPRQSPCAKAIAAAPASNARLDQYFEELDS